MSLANCAFLALFVGANAAFLGKQHQPVGVSMDDDTPARPPGYRNAWDDCGGAGASATERMRSIAASIKGFAKDVPFVRPAGQDCGHVDSAGFKPGPGTGIVYPGPKTWMAATDGLLTSANALEKFGAKGL